ncbi:hypothetical protein CC1G_10299 [Coprinopsis cinerea okayama7|uniref:Mitochondrial carrier n=1 Tax=Coprinopsis cinerea (strain Okayama-7 / 130 / ATCC MYA-4618 / FGSC 9003) TaxID=240176 RepID=A8N145_COPC7|nr:hypothetical protein CC1G_10299 [Coprinopsis cinerea okayama7\|eukprot:XP_001828628.2 hypothetical protein CC1G_10299 [Coprinopsis cinerea okayama7\
MTRPGSLRDLYIDPSSAWTFVPTTSNNATTAAQPPEPPSAPAYQWSSRPSHNSIFDLSPDLNLSEPSGTNVANVFKALVASAVLQYTSTAIVMPWEVGKLLLQVQWVPRDAGEPAPGEPELGEEDVDDALSDSSNDNDSYFADPNAPPSNRPLHRTDEQGYVIRRSVLEEGTRPEYIIPVGSADGVWDMMKRVGRFRPEGWLALWKGLLTSCVTEILSSTMQPFIDGFLQSLLFPSMSPFHQPPLILPVASHLITGFLLSPLDLIRTRLIVQPFMTRKKEASKEFISTLNCLFPLFSTMHSDPSSPLLFQDDSSTIHPVNISEDTHPRAWSIAELAGSCVGLLITLPIETIRRRLQVQVRGTAKPLKACVETRPAPYNGVVDTFWHILTEERSDLPIRYPQRRRRSSSVRSRDERKAEEDVAKEEALDGDGWSRHTGLGQLYRGLGMRLGASAIVFVIALWSGGAETDSGWTEI